MATPRTSKNSSRYSSSNSLPQVSSAAHSAPPMSKRITKLSCNRIQFPNNITYFSKSIVTISQSPSPPTAISIPKSVSVSPHMSPSVSRSGSPEPHAQLERISLALSNSPLSKQQETKPPQSPTMFFASSSDDDTDLPREPPTGDEDNSTTTDIFILEFFDEPDENEADELFPYF